MQKLGIDSLERLPLPSVLKADIELKLVDSTIVPFISQTNLELAVKRSSEDMLQNTSNTIPATSLSTSIPSNSPPQIYVKQGVSKCKECNIVFCKHENYLVHKQHYCSFRNLDEIDRDKKNTVVKIRDDGSTSVSYQQLICAACGIKYTSLDNLRAHQSFYCPKGANYPAKVSTEKDKCDNCKNFHDNTAQLSFNPDANNKCVVCQDIPISPSENRKYRENNEGVKAFRCSVCRYKGNTIRGMRTHIRMHFEKKKSDFNEESFMSCILEDDGMEISTTHIVDQDKNVSQQPYNCCICNYTSTYKGNVIRHTKLVHPQEKFEEDLENCSRSDEANVLTGQIENNARESVKAEPLELHNSNNIKMECNDQNEHIVDAIHANPNQFIGDESSDKTATQKYCETCDIKFNYMKTYIAHKQFYCKNKQNENASHSSTSMQFSSLLNIDKENVGKVNKKL